MEKKDQSISQFFFNSKIKVLMTTKSIFQTLFYFSFPKYISSKKVKEK